MEVCIFQTVGHPKKIWPNWMSKKIYCIVSFYECIILHCSFNSIGLDLSKMCDPTLSKRWRDQVISRGGVCLKHKFSIKWSIKWFPIFFTRWSKQNTLFWIFFTIIPIHLNRLRFKMALASEKRPMFRKRQRCLNLKLLYILPSLVRGVPLGIWTADVF
jgi:hypothetical protein